MYVSPNFKTKKAFRESVNSGNIVEAFQPPGCYQRSGTRWRISLPPDGIWPAHNGSVVTIEGPHYPEPHRWYARVEIDQDGRVVRFVS